MVKKSRVHKFTLVEFLTILSIIGISVGIGIIYKSHMQDLASDSKKADKMTSIVKSLEKYYLENGEYPSCGLMSQPTTDLANVLPDISKATLATVDESDDGNLILPNCGDIKKDSPSNRFAYIGDNECVTNQAQGCASFTLKYIEQSTGKAKAAYSKNI